MTQETVTKRIGRTAELLTDTSPEFQAGVLNGFAALCHKANKKWWLDLDRQCQCCYSTPPNVMTNCPDCGGVGHPAKDRNVGELLMLCVSELAEALEGHRKSLPDDKLPHRPMFEVEIADCLIRIFDLCAGKGLDIGGAFVEKMAYNRVRVDHRIENRKLEGGKKY